MKPIRSRGVHVAVECFRLLFHLFFRAGFITWALFNFLKTKIILNYISIFSSYCSVNTPLSVTKSSQLMLCNETSPVYSKNHTTRINSLCLQSLDFFLKLVVKKVTTTDRTSSSFNWISSMSNLLGLTQQLVRNCNTSRHLKFREIYGKFRTVF